VLIGLDQTVSQRCEGSHFRRAAAVGKLVLLGMPTRCLGQAIQLERCRVRIVSQPKRRIVLHWGQTGEDILHLTQPLRCGLGSFGEG
jgi:hypothetical protein